MQPMVFNSYLVKKKKKWQNEGGNNELFSFLGRVCYTGCRDIIWELFLVIFFLSMWTDLSSNLPFKPPRVQLSLLSSYRARHTVSGERLFLTCVFPSTCVYLSISISEPQHNLRREHEHTCHTSVKYTGAVLELLRGRKKKPQRFMLPHFSFYQAVNLTLYGVAMVTR